jgi:hypothetical protein
MNFNWKTIGIIVAVVFFILFFGAFFLLLYKTSKEVESQKQNIVQLKQNLQKEWGE